MEAQQNATIAGEYYLRGVMETASGFKLNDDNSFEFFYSYGALDRTGQGTWKLKDEQIILNGPRSKIPSFTLVDSKVLEDEFVTIKILEDNPAFLSSVHVMVKSGSKRLESRTENGLIRFSKQPVDSITLIFEYCPENTAVFIFTGKKENYFEFNIAPSVMDVYFESLVLTLDKTGFYGQHPLLKDGVYHFIKSH